MDHRNHEKEALELNIKILKNDLDKANGIIANLRSSLELSEIKRKEAELQFKRSEVQIIELTNQLDLMKLENKDVDFYETYKQLISDVNKILLCPLSMSELTNPVILPSGHTIQEGYFDELKRRRYKDPYDNSKILKDKVHNRFASEVIKIVKSSQELVNCKINSEDINELQRVQFADAEVQTDIQLNKIDDENKIKSLVFIISLIFK